jgi:hypothetical protein
VSIEDQVRTTFQEMAAEAAPAPLMQRIERARPARPRRRLVLSVAAAVVTLAVVASSVLVLRADDRAIVEPTLQPPGTLRLDGHVSESAAPGTGALLVVLADVSATDQVHEKPAYVLPTGEDRPVLLAESDVNPTWTEHLSLDGTRAIREVNRHPAVGDEQKWLEIVDLRTGRTTRLANGESFCPALSPDNRTVAANVEGAVLLIDVSSGRQRSLRAVDFCGGLAWTPDSTRLVLRTPDGSRIVDRRGRTVSRIPGLYVANGSMSWSPDGSHLLLYDANAGRFVIRDVDTGGTQVLKQPPDSVKPLGWAGSRVVWLTGNVGDQRLVTTGPRGFGPRLWTHLDTGGLPIEAVSWSTALSGSAAD